MNLMKKIRLEKGLTQKQVALKIDVPASTIGMLERKELYSGGCTLETIRRIEAFYGHKVKKLVGTKVEQGNEDGCCLSGEALFDATEKETDRLLARYRQIGPSRDEAMLVGDPWGPQVPYWLFVSAIRELARRNVTQKFSVEDQ